METANPSEDEGRERKRCEVSNCFERFKDSLRYAKHLDDHQTRLEDSCRKIKSILEDKKYAVSAPGHLVCSNCLKPVVEVSSNGNRETSLASLEQHKTDCSKQLQEIRQRLISEEGSHDKRIDKSRCEGCDDCIGPRLCSKAHEVSLSDLNCQTVLEFLEKKNWQICPYCLRVQRENLPFHFIIAHRVIYDIAVKLSPAQENEGQCGECGQSINGDPIRHRYLTCQNSEKNMRELFSKIKMEEVSETEKNDRVGLAMFQKRMEEDPSYLEKLLQQSRKEKKVPEVTRKSRRFSGNNLEPQRRSKEENMEKMIQDLYCVQCHRTFKDKTQAGDEKENKHHFCYVVGNLKNSLQIDPSPSPTKKAKLCCTFCPNLKNIVFSNPGELKKHLVLAHKTKFFIEEIQKQNMKKGLAKEDLKCFHTNCNVTSGSQEDHLIHVGVHHEKLFNALMHDKRYNMKNVAKELFPTKFKREQSHDWGRGSAGSSQKVPKRNLDRVDEGEAGPSKKAKPEEQKVSRSLSSDRNVETSIRLPGLSSKLKSTKPITAQIAPGAVNPTRRMKCETCVVCGVTQSNKTTLYNHLAGEHFYQEISRKFAQTGDDREAHFPCSFPGCSEVLPSALARVHHLGRRHGQVDLCLAAMEAAKKPKPNSARVKVFKCRKCSEDFATRALLKLHTCNSLLDKPPARERRGSVDYVGDVASFEREEKDMRGELSDASVDSSELNEAVGDLSQRTEKKDSEVEGDPWRGRTCEVAGGCRRKDCRECEYCGRRYHKKDQPHFPCDSQHCDLCFPTEKLMNDHFASSHGFEDFC